MTKPRKLLYWQVLTVTLLVIGYAGYYLCRSDLSVALPLIVKGLTNRGISADVARVRLADIASLGVLAYAIGKFVSGGVADFLGGRRNFLAGMGGSVLFTILFALADGFPLFTLSWFANRLVQSTGWTGMVKISSRWFSYGTYGTVMGVVSLSYLFGDAAARQFMAVLIGRGFGWRGVFLVAAGTLFVLFLLNLLLLRETPKNLGLEEPHANPLNLFKEEGEDPKPHGLSDLLGPLVRSWIFWLVCLLSLGFTLVRETFNLWTPTYFNQVGFNPAGAAQESALFPFFGGISVLVAGYASDRLKRGGRAAIIFYGLVLSGITLLALGYVNFGGSRVWPVALVTAVAFLMLGPYSYFAGAISLDFGGKHGSATAAGIIDGISYLGAVTAGGGMGRISVAYGWRGAFTVLAAVCWLSSVAALVYLRNQRKAVGSG
jgi:sugar phosphate permease